MELACWKLNYFPLVANLSCAFIEWYFLDVLLFFFFFPSVVADVLVLVFVQKARNRKERKKQAVGRFIIECFLACSAIFLSLCSPRLLNTNQNNQNFHEFYFNTGMYCENVLMPVGGICFL